MAWFSEMRSLFLQLALDLAIWRVQVRICMACLTSGSVSLFVCVCVCVSGFCIGVQTTGSFGIEVAKMSPFAGDHMLSYDGLIHLPAAKRYCRLSAGAG